MVVTMSGAGCQPYLEGAVSRAHTQSLCAQLDKSRCRFLRPELRPPGLLPSPHGHRPPFEGFCLPGVHMSTL